MDSTAEDARDGERARPTPPAAGDDGIDLISGHHDDVLLRILGHADARDAAHTAVLSRRWLPLWPRVPALRFNSRPASWAARGAERRAAMEEFASSVNGVLARRAGQPGGSAVETLSITYASGGHANLEELKQALSVDAVRRWIRYAFQLGVKSFLLDLAEYVFEHVVVLDELLPSPVRLETMRLALGCKSLRLPTAMTFASLADLSLEGIHLGPGGARLLGRFVSSTSCPRLRKLRMRKMFVFSYYVNEEMRVEADVLSELWMEDVRARMPLKLWTPRLRVFHIYESSHEMLTISGPRLEELAVSFRQGRTPKSLEIDGELPCVRSLKISLQSHVSCDMHHASSHREAEKDANVVLLKNCSSLTRLEVTLGLQGEEILIKDDVDMIKARIPQLPQITSLTVNVSGLYEWHDFEAGVAGLLTRFNNLKYLSLHLPFFHSDCNLHERLDLLCNHPDHWKSKEFSMAHLLELELRGFTGTECELWFTKAVLTTAKRVHKVTISLNPHCCQPEGKVDGFECMLVDEGMWAFHREKHMLTCLSCACRSKNQDIIGLPSFNSKCFTTTRPFSALHSITFRTMTEEKES